MANENENEAGGKPASVDAGEIAGETGKLSKQLKNLQIKFSELEQKHSASETLNQQMSEKLNLLSKIPAPGGKKSILQQVDEWLFGGEKKD